MAKEGAGWTLSHSAARDLAHEWDYLAGQSGRQVANQALDRIRSRLTTLVEHPYSGRRRDELRPGWRSAAVPPSYVIYYRVTPAGRVIVQRILHGRRDQLAALFD